MARSRSGAHNENLDLTYLLTIASAQKTLRIENAYFLPDDLMRTELTEAAKRGVKVEVVVPGKKIDQSWCACLETALVGIDSRRRADFRVSTDDGAREINDRRRYLRLRWFG